MKETRITCPFKGAEAKLREVRGLAEGRWPKDCWVGMDEAGKLIDGQLGK